MVCNSCYIIFLELEYDSLEEISNSPAELKLVIFFLFLNTLQRGVHNAIQIVGSFTDLLLSMGKMYVRPPCVERVSS